MTIFTTNWYLYKTCLNPTTAKPQKRDATSTDVYKPKTACNPNTNNKTQDFEELLRESIDDGLSLLGESAKQVVYFHLEKTFKINRQNIPYRIEEFIAAIEKIFGIGAKILEIQMMKSLFKKFGCTTRHHPRQKDLEFTEYVEAIKLAKEI